MRWSGRGWTAEVVDNEDGGGWALAMTRDGDREPTLVVPWVMGRNKKDPKPLNQQDFVTQVKAAQDFSDRREKQRKAHQISFGVTSEDGQWVRVVCEITPDEYEPEAHLVALDRAKEELARVSCPLNLKLTRAVAQAWVNGGFQPMDDLGPSW
jgi:hypothetical protein